MVAIPYRYLGPGVSRVLDPAGTSYTEVIFQAGKPPCDAEFNLLQELAFDFTRKYSCRSTPSGWLGNETNTGADFVTNPIWSNWFKFGTQRTGEYGSVMWAAVNGWLVPVTGTRTGTPPGSPDDVNTWNVVALDPPPSNAGDYRTDFVFLEVWQARIPPSPQVTNKPSASAVYRYGNVEGGYSFLSDNLTDPTMGFETTQRVQLQYRIRVVRGLVGLTSAPDGFDATVVKAQGASAAPTSFTFTNMRQTLGDPGLWRAGDGLQNALGTVDGYSYAIPLCAVFRRNTMAWVGDPSPNLNGGFNRNPTAVDRTGIQTFSTVPTLQSALNATSNTAFLTSGTAVPLPSSPATPVLIRVGDELMTYTALVQGSPSSLTGITRGVNGTRAEAHAVGTPVTVISGRPDGLFSDQVTKTDILDLRHLVNPNGFDYTALLQSNLDQLLKGQLRANWKRSGAGPQGPFVAYQDKLSADPAALGVTRLDAPDGIRTVFSDASVVQQMVCIVAPNGSAVTVPPYPIISPEWDLKITAYATHQGTGNQFNPTDVILVPVNQLCTGLPGGDADQVRWLVDNGAVTIRVDGQSSPVSSSTYSVAVDGNGDLTITLGASFPAATTGRLYLTLSAIYGPGRGLSRRPDSLHSIAFSSPSSRLLTRSPYTDGGNAKASTAWLPLWSKFRNTLYKGALPVTAEAYADLGSKTVALTPFQRITWPTSTRTMNGAPLHPNAAATLSGDEGFSDGLGPTFLNMSATFPAFEDYCGPGDQLVIQGDGTYTVVNASGNTLTVDRTVTGGGNLDWTLMTGQGLMPRKALDGATAKWATTDPLGLFSSGTQSGLNSYAQRNIYVTLPRQSVPGWGEVRVPVLAADNNTFSEGVNYMCFTGKGSNANPNYVPYPAAGVSWAVFSTVEFSTGLPATYNAQLTVGAGMRFFTDTRGFGRTGLELPPFYGIARLFGVYEAADYQTHGSPYNSVTRNLTNAAGATNLLRQDVGGASFWIEVDVDGDSTFILNSEAVDISKSPNPIASFGAGNYVIEASIFGFDRGSFSGDEFRLVLSRVRPNAISATRTDNVGVDIPSPITVLPGPATVADTALTNYSRTPYQGDAWGSQTSYVDVGYEPGPLLSSIAYQIDSTNLNENNLTRPNQKPLEVLASTSFATTLGTGRLAGDLELARVFDVRTVGYENPSSYPPPTPLTARPQSVITSFGTTDALEVGTEYLGCTERLPMGALFRDKDFRGQTFGDSGPVAPLVFYGPTVGVGTTSSLSVNQCIEQLEVALNTSTTASGVPGEVLVHVDGEQGNYAILTNFRTNRGGSAYVANGSHPGGEILLAGPNLLSATGHTNVLVGRAFLVRNYVTSIGQTEVSSGSELMMLVVTSVCQLKDTAAHPGTILISTNGAGEGYAAADLYRIGGHPLVNDNVRQIASTSIPLSKNSGPVTIILPPT